MRAHDENDVGNFGLFVSRAPWTRIFGAAGHGRGPKRLTSFFGGTVLDKPHISRTGNATRRRNNAIANSGVTPRLTSRRLRKALADLIRWYAGPIRKELQRGPGPSISVDDGWVS